MIDWGKKHYKPLKVIERRLFLVNQSLVVKDDLKLDICCFSKNNKNYKIKINLSFCELMGND